MSAGSDAGSLHAVVLAAGGSSRFGSAKQLVRIGDRPLLSLIAGRAAEVVGHALIVVLGAAAAELAPLLRHSPGSVVINRSWREGLASSIRAGIARVPASSAGVMLVLADQACVTAEDLRRLAGVWRRQPECRKCGSPPIRRRAAAREMLLEGAVSLSRYAWFVI